MQEIGQSREQRRLRVEMLLQFLEQANIGQLLFRQNTFSLCNQHLRDYERLS